MSTKRLPQEGPQVKKDKRRTVPDGIALTKADILKLTKRAQGPKKNLASKIKWAFRTYIEKCPDHRLTSATKRVACFLVDWYRLEDGHARPPISRIAEELVIDKRSAERAVATLHKLGLIFVKSGGPTRRRGLGTVASRYVPNFWLVINRDTGEIVRNAKYDFSGCDPQGYAGDYRQDDDRPPYRQDAHRVDPLKPIGGAGDYRQNAGRYLSTKAGATATPPASANATAGGSATRKEKEEIRFTPIRMLAPRLRIESTDLIRLLRGKGSPAEIKSLHAFCKSEIFNFGKPVSGILLDRLPDTVRKIRGRVVICGDSGKVDFVEDGLAEEEIESNGWLAIHYRISPAYKSEISAKVQELKIGV